MPNLIVQDVLTIGDDALASQFEISFPEGLPGGGDEKHYRLRCDQPIDTPAESIGTYDIMRKGRKITKTNREETTEKTITVSIRLDETWQIYYELLKWKRYSFDPITGGSAIPDGIWPVSIRAPFVISSLNRNNDPAHGFIYTKAKPISIKVTAFDPSSDQPLRVEVVFIYSCKKHFSHEELRLIF